MKKLSLALLVLLGAFSAYAQAEPTGVTESTDPEKISAIEQHAQELQAKQAKAPLPTEATSAGKKKARHHRKARMHQAQPDMQPAPGASAPMMQY